MHVLNARAYQDFLCVLLCLPGTLIKTRFYLGLSTLQLFAQTSHQPWRLEDTVDVKTGF
ncbi:hypothetical protein LEMLEM_LOCUS11763 [Lemmus lemmus]